MTVIIHDEYTVQKDDYSNAGKASSLIKEKLKNLGISVAVLRKVAVACYEAEINMLIHAWGGTIKLEVDDHGTITLWFDDVGPGIIDLEKALTPGFSTASEKARSMGFGAGMGLPNMKRVSDEFHITSSPLGTHLTMRFYEHA